MELKKPSIVIWCGAAPNQKALAVKLSRKFSVAGIVIDEKQQVGTGSKKSGILSSIIDRLRFHSLYQAWKDLQQYYQQQFSSWPEVPVLRVPAINSKETREFTEKLQPGLVIVSGTGLIKKELLDVRAGIGIINLHTGLSPYVKGGPNCTNWCIANNEWQLIGNTIMWLNAGIDAGNIISSETVDITNTGTLFDAQKRVMEHAHELYGRTVDYLLHTAPPYNAVSQQSLGKGNLYLTKEWTAEKRSALLKNWKKRRSVTKTEPPVTVALPANYQK